MKISKRARTIILWGVAIGLLLGMVISFTPTLGLNLGGQEAMRGTVQLTVNGAEVREAEVLQAQQGSLYSAVSEGPVARQLERLLVDDIVRQEVIRQAAAPMRVSGGAVRTAVDDFRESRGVAGRANDTAYLNLIRSAGFTDETFREYMAGQLRLSAWEESVVGDVEVTEAEIEAFYLSHQSAYQGEERVRARQIVVADRETADELRAQVSSGASFAELAAEHSLELADRGGAVGAQPGESEPRPVSRAAFPTAVANAAFSLRGAGITPVVEAAGAYYLVEVLEYLPAQTRPFDEVRDTVAEDALETKRQGAITAELERLRESAVVTFPATSTLGFENGVVAQVGDAEITEVELDRATYMNSTIQQALSPDNADLIVQIFRPAILQQLINDELAFQGAQGLGVDFVGPKSAVAAAALNYVARDAQVTEDEIVAYYENNVAAFTVSPEAVVTQAEFDSQEAAAAFREDVLGGAVVAEAAAARGGELTEHGRVLPGTLEPDLDAALFATDAFDQVEGGEAEVSDLLVLQRTLEQEESADEPAEEGDEAQDEAPDAAPVAVERFVVLVAERTPERVRPLEDVRAQIENTVLASNRQRLQSEWLASLREEIEVREFAIVDLEDEPAFTVPPVAPADEDGDDIGDEAGGEPDAPASEGGEDVEPAEEPADEPGE